MNTKILELVIAIFSTGTAIGFVLGYMVRAAISQRRRARAKRNRIFY
jgi:hypothetical protein